MKTEPQSDLEPVAAYDRLAPCFEAIRSRTQKYCAAVDRVVLSHWPVGARSMIDVGCGEAERAEAIATHAGIQELVLLEPSSGMRALIRSQREVWTSRIENLKPTNRTFDVITCLWNVLGHVPSPQKKLQALRNMRDLLSPGGTLFIDVQNRYNARRYGTWKTAGRIVRDLVRPSSSNGDVTAAWPSKSGWVRAYGHVFTRKEIRQMFCQARLTVRKSFVIDYATGEEHSSPFGGSMLFILAR